MVKIVQKEDPVLRGKAQNVPAKDIGSPAINKIISEMKAALESQDDGVAIAAPQIGVPMRIFVVSKKVFDFLKDESGEEAPAEKTPNEDLVFINPSITKTSKTKQLMEEGCLSVRWLYGKVERSTKATVEAYDEKGKKFSRGGSGLLAQIFQHEMDHLDGVLFIDKAKEIEDLPPEKQDKKSAKNA